MESQNAAFYRTGSELLKRLKPLSERKFVEVGKVIDGSQELVILQDEYGSQWLRAECVFCHKPHLIFVYPDRLASAVSFVLHGEGKQCPECRRTDQEVYENMISRQPAFVAAGA